VLVITANSVLTPAGWTQPSSVTVNDAGVIVDIAPTSGPVHHRSLVPGFVDLQVNGVDDIDVSRADGRDWIRIGELLIEQGVTSWCPTLVTAPLSRYELPLNRIAEAQALAQLLPAIIGAHLEGPFLGGAPGAHRRDMLAPIDLAWLAALPTIVRLVTLAPELELAAEAIELLVERGIIVSLGHSTPSIAQSDTAVQAGAAMATHLFNGMSGVHHRDPGLAAYALVNDRLTVGLIADLIHVHPLAIELAFRAKQDHGVVLVTDAVAWRAGTAGAVGLAMSDGAPRLADGTLAGSALTMDAAIRNVVNHCSVSLEQAVRAASTNPARLIGCADRGVIAVGQRGDLVELDDELRVGGVWLNGVRAR
jgi:N-acetylglucosamine-6-phosphate deacetylase